MAFGATLKTAFQKDIDIVVPALVQALRGKIALARGAVKNRKYAWYYRNFDETPAYKVFDPVRPYMIIGEVEHLLSRAESQVTWKLIARIKAEDGEYESLKADILGKTVQTMSGTYMVPGNANAGDGKVTIALDGTETRDLITPSGGIRTMTRVNGNIFTADFASLTDAGYSRTGLYRIRVDLVDLLSTLANEATHTINRSMQHIHKGDGGGFWIWRIDTIYGASEEEETDSWDAAEQMGKMLDPGFSVSKDAYSGSVKSGSYVPIGMKWLEAYDSVGSSGCTRIFGYPGVKEHLTFTPETELGRATRLLFDANQAMSPGG
ncbi:MAG: hypothetical protein AAF317_19640 [Pseudomonadota bacterium]